MTEDDYDALSQKHLASIKRDMRVSLEDAAVRATHKVMAELDCVGWFGYNTGLRLWFETNKGDDGAIPLYKDQPQREWVGLMDEDFDWLEQVFGNKVSNNFVLDEIVCVISAKLKQKNGYAEEKNT